MKYNDNYIEKTFEINSLPDEKILEIAKTRLTAKEVKFDGDYYCPSCGETIIIGEKDLQQLKRIAVKHKYCEYCGQKLRWYYANRNQNTN